MTIHCHSTGAQSTAQGKHAVLSQSEHSMLVFYSKFKVYQISEIVQVTKHQPFDNTATSSLKSLLCVIYWYMLGLGDCVMSKFRMPVGSERLLTAFSVLFLCYQYCENRYIWSSSEICLYLSIHA